MMTSHYAPKIGIALHAVLFGIIIGFLPATVAAKELPPKVAAVQKFLLDQDYPEVFGEQHYRIKVEDAIVADIDDDGKEEVLLLVKPHYRQSPTILFFKVSKNMKVTRVMEGLAPGPLVPISGDYLDSHTLGMGIDLTVAGMENDIEKRKQAVSIALKEMGGVVEYRNFIHTDGRTGKPPVYIDMTHLKAPKNATCEAFEFSTVDAMQVGSKDDGSGNYLLALVGKELYVYKIKKITADGFLQKTLAIKKAK
ncbi:MAG: hypothetical protein A2X56_12085 [Nitrospirae bacterium GWC2_57_13]|nr:MAG: hypothetical protein A2X56_12085 [Nitrospirae bacterium GWC2_57_13]HAS53034.1 hypothetical protein [Nitrospiraceae bacterium]